MGTAWFLWCNQLQPAISPKRCEIGPRLLWRTNRKFATTTQNFNRYYLRNGQNYELQILYSLSYDCSQQKPINNFEKSSRGHSQGLTKICRAFIYRAHHTVIFAIAQLSCTSMQMKMYCLSFWLSNIIALLVHWHYRLGSGRACSFYKSTFSSVSNNHPTQRKLEICHYDCCCVCRVYGCFRSSLPSQFFSNYSK